MSMIPPRSVMLDRIGRERAADAVLHRDGWRDLDQQASMVFRGPTIDGKQVGNTVIGTASSAVRVFVPARIVLLVTAASGVITASTVSVGTNASTYNNVRAGVLVANAPAGEAVQYALDGVATATVADGVDLVCRVSVAAIATTFSFRIAVFGCYL